MQSLIGSLFFIRYPYSHAPDRRRATGILYLLTGVRLIWIAWAVTTGIPALLDGDWVTIEFFLVALVPMPVVLINFAVQHGRLRAASKAIVVATLPLMIIMLGRSSLQSANFIVVALPIVAAGLLLEKRAFWLTVGAVALALGWLVLDEFGTLDAVARADVIGGCVIAAFLSGLFLAFGQSVTVSPIDETQLRRLEQVSRFKADVSRDSEAAIFRQALELLRTGMGYYFSQLFLAENDGQLVQRIRRGFTNAEVLQVSLSEMNALSRAARSQKIIAISNSDPATQREHLMPFSAYGLVVPIIVDGRTLGVIDVQSNAAPFSEEDRAALGALADQLATLIRDVRAIRSLKENLADQEQALVRLRTQVREYGATEREGISSVWDAYLEQRGKQALGFDLKNDGHLIERDNLPESMREALKRGQIVLQKQDEWQLMIVPIALRDQILGAMSFQLPLDQSVSQRRMETAQSVAQRLAVALENQRLFEQSRLQALRERKASEVGGLLLSATDIDQVLDLAANSFNEALGAIQTTIYLQPETVQSPQEVASQKATRRLQDPSVYASQNEGADS
jgi:GAF domain-containing protein